MTSIPIEAARRAPRRLALSVPRVRPELAALLGVAGLLNVWALQRNGFADEYYSAAVRAMSSDWHAFLYGSFDSAGVMTVDKPPLALWVQALSVKAFGFDSLSMLVPQALMGVASVALVYDLVRRRFGRAGGFVGGAWPALIALTPADERPWIAGTSDNGIVSLILGYNGVGRLGGQSGEPAAMGGPGGGVFGGDPGVLRLLDSSLGGQAGWLLGFALVAGLALVAASRLRRADARTGWVVAVGGAFAVTAVAFSFAQGIFHPYYVSLLAPFTAALVGAGAAQLVGQGRTAAILAPAAVVAGMATELAVQAKLVGELKTVAPVMAAAC